ncbi:unconventional myosin-XVIIIa-like isoform X4 [Mytilus californianus]|uniref:unconventional myosin-XVIIIa-like isoform X4 n=1 Tax=Mytilus californianus TaxID=6549 RepID=UPI00224584B5|nr:unconventional myosin-XVIIIa-like isoform X4 [Mytilus californianus]
MFSRFGHKSKDKDQKDKKEKDEKKKEKKEKKEREKKEKQREPMTQEEMSRLDEVKKGIFRRVSDRDKKRSIRKSSPQEEGVPRDSSDSSISSGGHKSPSVEELPKPQSVRPVPEPRKFPPTTAPKPKSILKAKSSNPQSVTSDPQKLQENTISNCLNAHIVGEQNGEIKHSVINGTGESSPQLPTSPPKSPPETSHEKSFNAKLKLPDIIPPKPPRIRELVLQRQPTGGFGFSLRKGIITEKGGGDEETKHFVIFAEPGSGPKAPQTGLIPGDRLVEVNGVNVQTMTREEVVEIIQKSGDILCISVQPIPELIELSVRPASDGGKIEIQDDVVKGGTLKRSVSLRYKKGARSETEVQTEKEWMESEKVWLVHKGGFASACVLKANGMSVLPEGRLRIKLDHAGDTLDVDEDDVEKANPPQYDRAEDIAALRFINESSALHILRQRYGANLVHTYCGPSLAVINPMHPISIYSEKVMQIFKGCKQEDMPPHIYAMGQITYREMLQSRSDQSVVFMGRSGSGKTSNSRHVMQYLITAAGSVANIFTVERLTAVSTLMEAFGNSRTILNTNASRYAQLTTLDFDHSGQISSASVQVFMFEKSRVVRRPEGEPSFHVFYQMLAGLDSALRTELQLNSLNEPNMFMTPLQRHGFVPSLTEDKQKAMMQWGKICTSMDQVGMTEDEKKAICHVLAAIYHLGVAGAIKGQNNKPQFAKPGSAQKAASLLGLSSEELLRQIFSSSGSSTLTRGASTRSSPAHKQEEGLTNAIEALEGFVIGLYSDVFNAVVSLINRSLSSNYRTSTSISILDTPGFQNPSSCGRQTGATFEDLCHNYSQERLQLLFHDITFTMQQDKYSQEGITCDFEFVTSSPASMVSLIDKPAQQNLNNTKQGLTKHPVTDHHQIKNTSQEMKDSERKGLLWILDEESMFPGATEDSFMDRFFTHHGEQKVRRDSLLRKASTLGNTFILNHFQGTNPVQYNASGWLKGCRDNPNMKVATQVLQDSKRQNINELFNSVKAPVAGMVSGSIVGMEGSASLRRVGSMRRTFMSGTAGLKKRSMCLQVKFQVDSIIETVRKTKCHFVHCILPQHNAGLWELKTPSVPQDKPGATEEVLMNVTLVRSQIRGSELLDSVRIFRQGFPDNMGFGEFRQRFEGLLSPNNKPAKDLPEKQAILHILDNLDLDKLNYRVGLSQVFFRAGALSQLEAARDEKITGTVVAFQARCRGILGRKKLKELRVKHIAISCIQKNVKKFMLIRDWAWWRLFTKVQPMLNVHRTEEQLQEREIEVEHLKSKLEKIERERNEYKQLYEKTDSRMSEVQADLIEEHSTATHASEMLESETAERMQLSKEHKDLQGKYNALKRQAEKIEMELTQVHLWQAEALDFNDEDADGNDSVYKDRYERVLRELDMTKKRLQKQHEEELETEQHAKKAVEKRLHDAIEDGEDQRRLLAASKKKASRLAAEMQDTKLHLEEQMTRNNELERKQRRFDSELSKIQEEVKSEKSMRERLQREKDEFMSKNFTLEQELTRLKGDLESVTEKADRLDREMIDVTLAGSMSGGNEVMSLKKAKNDLDAKCKDQEEELDEQAGQIQQLEQTKIRLEMNYERTRQQHQKELEEKEEEMEEMRYSTQKKVKHYESQLEEEYDEKKKLMQEKKELERQIQELGAVTNNRDRESEKRLRRDLRKTKALLKDAEVVIQKQTGAEGMKATIRQLRNTLDDKEFACSAAVKAKKSMELEIEDLQQQLDDISKAKTEAESKSLGLMREKAELQSQVEENEEDLNDVMRKYKAVVQQQSVDQITMADNLKQIEELTNEKDKYRSEVDLLQTRLKDLEENYIEKTVKLRLEGRIRELENKLELETTSKHRIEVTLNRIKEQVDKLSEERDSMKFSKTQAEENLKRSQRQLRELREEFSDVQKKELEYSHKNTELEHKVVELETDYQQNHSDLKLAFKRISDLQAALQEDVDSDDSLLSDSDADSDDGVDLTNIHLTPQKSYQSPRTTSLSSTSSHEVTSPRLSNLEESIFGIYV